MTSDLVYGLWWRFLHSDVSVGLSRTSRSVCFLPRFLLLPFNRLLCLLAPSVLYILRYCTRSLVFFRFPVCSASFFASLISQPKATWIHKALTPWFLMHTHCDVYYMELEFQNLLLIWMLRANHSIPGTSWATIIIISNNSTSSDLRQSSYALLVVSFVKVDL